MPVLFWIACGIGASLLIGFLLYKFSTKPEPEDVENILEDIKYDWRGNKSHHLN